MVSTVVSQQLITHTAVGAVTLEEVTQAMERWFADPQFDPDKPVLWDIRQARVEVEEQPEKEVGAAGSGGIAAWSDHHAEMISEKRPGRKTAWVFGTTELADQAVELLGTRDWQNRVRIFHDDMEAAIAWLTSTIR